jgi:hypothetical protein
MILTDEITTSGERRIYFTQFATVVTYFTESEDGGVAVHAEPGEFACPWSTTPEKIEGVRLAMLAEVARRLDCDVAAVVAKTLDEIAAVSDPLLDARPHWASRAKRRIPGRPAAKTVR